MAAVKHFSRARGHAANFHLYHRLYLLLRGIKRAHGLRYSLPKRLPVTPTMLLSIRASIFSSFRPYQDKLMLWAALVSAFFGFLRVSEYTSTHKTKFDPGATLLYTDLLVSRHFASLRIKSSKTDPFRQGVTIRLATTGSTLCPIKALRNFLPHHPSRQGPLFTFHNGRYLTRNDINTALSTATNGAANISSHSLRIGAASTAAASGCPKYMIKSLGRWSSDCFRRYIRIPDRTIKDLSRDLANCSISVPNNFNPALL